MIFGYKSSQETYVEYLKKCGIKVGEHIEIFHPRQTVIETLNPHLLKIGNFVSMTGPVTILCHDYSVCVLKKWTNGEILGKQRATEIGDNVFLGYGCCVLPGSKVGDNTVIGAYSVVCGELQEDSVYAGNPARRICSIEEFYQKTKKRQLAEACDVYIKYKINKKQRPPKELFHEYFYLFEKEKVEKLPEVFKKAFYNHGNYEESIAFFSNHQPKFNSFDEFCEYADAIMGRINNE